MAAVDLDQDGSCLGLPAVQLHVGLALSDSRLHGAG